MLRQLQSNAWLKRTQSRVQVEEKKMGEGERGTEGGQINAEHTASAFRKTVTSQSVLTLILYIAAVYAKENTFIRKVIRYQLMRWYGVIRVSLPCF